MIVLALFASVTAFVLLFAAGLAVIKDEIDAARLLKEPVNAVPAVPFFWLALLIAILTIDWLVRL